MDEGLIYERLKALSGGLEREQYRDISKAFEEVVRYNRRALEELKEQIHHELRDVSERFYLYGAVTEIGDAPIVNDFLFPMSRDASEEAIATIFCQCSREEMEEIVSSPQELILETDEGAVELTAQIRRCERYLNKIRDLQQVYYENGLYWRTPFLPYVGRFADVYCQSFDRERPIRSIRFKHREIPVRHDLLPLWNVEEIKLKCTVFPVPAIDEKNYRHTLRLPFPQDGYAVAMDHAVKNVYFSRDCMEVITTEKQQRSFNLYRIAIRRDINVPHYPITANTRRMRHIDRQADYSAVRLRTRAEISRIVGSYEVSRGLELAEIREGGTGRVQGTTDRYQFCPPGRVKLLLCFRLKEPETFISQDALSFLISEVQEYFPELWITGELDKEELHETSVAGGPGGNRSGHPGE